MGIVATTITEYYELRGEKRGENRGEKRGEKRATIHELERNIENFTRLYESGALTESAFQEELAKTYRRLAEIKKKSKR